MPSGTAVSPIPSRNEDTETRNDDTDTRNDHINRDSGTVR
jgi:hypothetical protein